MFFFFKQKTAYEMRISDWSSDVCSSDLKYGWYPRSLSKIYVHEPRHRRFLITALAGSSPEIPLHRPSLHATSRISAIRQTNMFDDAGQRALPMGPQRPEARRGGEECARSGRNRWTRGHEKKKKKK